MQRHEFEHIHHGTPDEALLGGNRNGRGFQGPQEKPLLSGPGWFRTSDLSRVKRGACFPAGRKGLQTGMLAKRRFLNRGHPATRFRPFRGHETNQHDGPVGPADERTQLNPQIWAGTPLTVTRLNAL